MQSAGNPVHCLARYSAMSHTGNFEPDNPKNNSCAITIYIFLDG
ncbi:hypothetical protein SAMN05444064_11847 [Pseudomonas syringae]|nr:hypothetical protein SAMN05444514_11847 [Pseudomonas syringae]SFM47060.1 hypothetical protein SAMN05444064_11847 [Pseudomonas syringae]